MNKDPLTSVALLVIDMQAPLLRLIPGEAALVNRCRFAMEAARLLGIRTFLTAQVPEKLGAVVSPLTQLAGERSVYPKTAFSALQAPGLRDVLDSGGIDHLILAGVETPICVYQTAIEAMNDDLSVTLLSDCVGGRRAGDASAIMAALAQTGCHILPSETVFYSILGHAGHPVFRQFTTLVKKHSDNPLSER